MNIYESAGHHKSLCVFSEANLDANQLRTIKHFAFGPLIMSMHFKDSLSNSIERERLKPTNYTIGAHFASMTDRCSLEKSLNQVMRKIMTSKLNYREAGSAAARILAVVTTRFFGSMWLRHFKDTRIFINRYPYSMLLIVFLPNLKRLYEHLPKL